MLRNHLVCTQPSLRPEASSPAQQTQGDRIQEPVTLTCDAYVRPKSQSTIVYILRRSHDQVTKVPSQALLITEQGYARGIQFLLSAEYSAVMSGAWLGTLVTWLWLCLCCALRLWSQICGTCQSYWFPDLVTLSCCLHLYFFQTILYQILADIARQKNVKLSQK